MAPIQHLIVDPTVNQPPTRDTYEHNNQIKLPSAKETKLHPTNPGSENASIYFVGNATTILEWEGIRVMTDPNFLHKGDHVHLGPGVTSERLTDPGVDMKDLPRIDVVLLSHYHEDHFDKEVEASLRRSLPIITTPHAKSHLSYKGDNESFTEVYELEPFQSMMVDIKKGAISGMSVNRPDIQRVPAMKVTGMPGKHVPPGVLESVSHIAKGVPPTNGWMLELGYTKPSGNETDFRNGYHIYISGDTLMVDELREIPERYKGQNIDLMLIHLGGTSLPSAKMPLLMVTMDAVMGLRLVQLINPDLTIPIHYNDYDVFASPLSDFRKKMEEAGLSKKVIYLEHKDAYKFKVNGDS